MSRTLSVFVMGVVLSFASPLVAQETEETSEGEPANAVGDLEVEEADDGTYIRIRGDQEPTFSVFKLSDPLRLVVDVTGSQLEDESMSRRVDNGVISKVALTSFEDDSKPVARLIVGFDKAAHYDVNSEGNEVVVFVDGDKRSEGTDSVARMERQLEEKEDELERTQRRLEEVESKYRDQIDDGQQRLQSARSELEEAQKRLDEARQERDRLEGKLAEADGDERRQLEDSIADTKEQIASARQDVERHRSAMHQREDNIEAIESDRDEATAELDETEQKLVEEREEARDEVARLKEERDKAQARADDLEDELGSTRQSLESVSSEKDELKTRLDEMAGDAEESNSRLEEQRAKLDAARDREEELNEQVEQLRTSLSEDEKDEQKRAELERMQEERSELRERLQDQSDRVERAQREAKEANGRVSELTELVEKREDEVSKLRAELESARKNGAESEKTADRLEEMRQAIESERERVAKLEDQRREREEGLSEAERELEETEDKIEKRQERLDRLADRDDLPAGEAVPVDPSESNAVKDIRLETDDSGERSRIIVELDRPSEFETLPAEESRAVMMLNDVELPEKLEKTLSADSEGGALRFVSTYTDEEGQVRMEAEVDDEVSEFVRQDGDEVVWEFAPKVGQDDKDEPLMAEGAPEPSEEGKAFTSAPPRGYPRTVSDPTEVDSVPGMDRKRLTIDLRQADIDNVLRLIAKEGGVNIITDDGVGGNVTMRLRGVPLDEAFLTILQAQGLGFEVRGDVLRVAPQETLREEESKRAEARAQREKTQPLEVFLLPVNYASASDLQGQVDSLLSPRGSVTVDERTNTLIIKDLAENLESVRSLVNNLDSQVPQVLIEARIVETNDTFDRELGIQWGGDFSFSQGNGNPTGL
ncbi:MAG: secretin N-terminal domain-containing protein, partial [Persicimonas sp.]